MKSRCNLFPSIDNDLSRLGFHIFLFNPPSRLFPWYFRHDAMPWM